MPKRLFGLLLIALLALPLTAFAQGGDEGQPQSNSASATILNANGEEIGTAQFYDTGGGYVEVYVDVEGLEPGFHGMHVHNIGVCDPEADPPFSTAGEHLNPDGASHPDHAGDLPSLLVMNDGTAALATLTDRFTVADLMDADGSALMIHSQDDNFANIPERYGEPDEETLNTGDSGERVGCGVIEMLSFPEDTGGTDSGAADEGATDSGAGDGGTPGGTPATDATPGSTGGTGAGATATPDAAATTPEGVESTATPTPGG